MENCEYLKAYAEIIEATLRGNLTLGVANSSKTDWTVQPQKMAEELKFQILKVE